MVTKVIVAEELQEGKEDMDQDEEQKIGLIEDMDQDAEQTEDLAKDMDQTEE